MKHTHEYPNGETRINCGCKFPDGDLCPNCGHISQTQQNFCVGCGQQLRDLAPARASTGHRPTIVVNFFGAAGAGKSTTAAEVFAELKKHGVLVELAREFVKEHIWEGNHAVLGYPVYCFGQQHQAIARLLGKVDVVVTDSPIVLASWYAHPEHHSEQKAASGIIPPVEQFSLRELEALSWAELHRMGGMHFWIDRGDRPWEPEGRLSTESHARAMDAKMLRWLGANGLTPTMLTADGTAGKLATHMILQRLAFPQ